MVLVLFGESHVSDSISLFFPPLFLFFSPLFLPVCSYFTCLDGYGVLVVRPYFDVIFDQKPFVSPRIAQLFKISYGRLGPLRIGC